MYLKGTGNGILTYQIYIPVPYRKDTNQFLYRTITHHGTHLDLPVPVLKYVRTPYPDTVPFTKFSTKMLNVVRSVSTTGTKFSSQGALCLLRRIRSVRTGTPYTDGCKFSTNYEVHVLVGVSHSHASVRPIHLGTYTVQDRSNQG